MDLTRPYADVITGARGRIVASLVQMAPGSATVRELAARSETSPQGALDVVNDLAASGIVETERHGRSLVVTLNSDHLMVRPLADLVGGRARLVDRLTAHLATWDRSLDAAWLFGSAARGDGGRDSDIDLVLVASESRDERWEGLTDALRGQIRRWTGNVAQLIDHDRASFTELVESGNPLISSLRAEGIALTPGARRRLRAET